MVNVRGSQLLKVLSASIFVAGMRISPAHIGWVFLVFRLADAYLIPFIGWISDNNRSRWDRKWPWVLHGSILTSLISHRSSSVSRIRMRRRNSAIYRHRVDLLHRLHHLGHALSERANGNDA